MYVIKWFQVVSLLKRISLLSDPTNFRNHSDRNQKEKYFTLILLVDMFITFQAAGDKYPRYVVMHISGRYTYLTGACFLKRNCFLPKL